MSNRFAGFIVTMKDDIREEHAERIMDAFRMLDGVLSIKPIQADYSQLIAEERARADLGTKLWNVLYPELARNDGER